MRHERDSLMSRYLLSSESVGDKDGIQEVLAEHSTVLDKGDL